MCSAFTSKGAGEDDAFEVDANEIAINDIEQRSRSTILAHCLFIDYTTLFLRDFLICVAVYLTECAYLLSFGVMHR